MRHVDLCSGIGGFALGFEWAGLSKRVVLTGQGNKFEVWDESTWDGQRDAWVEVARQFGDSDGVEVAF